MKIANYALVAWVLTGSSVALAHGTRGGNGPRAHWAEVDTNKDGKISLDESRKASEAHFSKLDTNNDGVVTQAEVTAAKETHRAQFQAKAGERFAAKDVNKDGKLSADEVPHMPEAWFKQLDTNKDDALSQEEFLSRGPGHRGDGKGFERGPQRWLEKLDANKDGQLSKAEAKSASDEHFRRMDRNADGYIAQDEQGHRMGREGHAGYGCKEQAPAGQPVAPKK
jgi:Ca2+-binding EF-hand superfamily protein